MKVKAEVVSVARDGEQRWTSAGLITVELVAEDAHDNRTFKVQIPQHLEKSFYTGRRVIIEVRPIGDR